MNKELSWEKILEHEKLERGFDWQKVVNIKTGEIDTESIDNHLSAVKEQMYGNLKQSAVEIDEDLDMDVFEKDVTSLFSTIHLEEDYISTILSKKGDDFEESIKGLIFELQSIEKVIKESINNNGSFDTGIVKSIFTITGGAVTAYKYGPIVFTFAASLTVTALLLFTVVIIAISVLLAFTVFKEVRASFLLANFRKDRLLIIEDIYTHHGKTTVVPGVKTKYTVNDEYKVDPALFDKETGKLLVACSFLCFSKRQGALYGSCGTTKINIMDAEKNNIIDDVYFTHDIPLTFLGGKNGVYLTNKKYSSLNQAFNDGDDNRKTEVVISNNVYKMKAKVNSSSGTVVFGALELK